MRVCVVSSKECWQDRTGAWMSSGGFPVQMQTIGSLFDGMTLVVVRGQPGQGGLPLPQYARVVPLRRPAAKDTRRKLWLLMHLPYYLRAIAAGVRKADVVDVPLPGDIPFLGMLVAQALGKRLLVRYEGSWAPNSQTTLMNRLTRGWMRLFAGGRNVMVALGDGNAPPARGMHWFFATVLSRSELEMISPVVDRWLSDPPRLVYAGRLSPEKGVMCLVEAVSLLKRGGFRPLPLVTLVGDGPDRRRLEEAVKALDCQELVSLRGQLDRRDLSAEFGQADVCVQPSLSEGWCKAWLDAMAHGLPVLASDVGAARTVIGANGERGWLVPPGDAQALAMALRRVLRDAVDWPVLRRRCRSYVERFTVETWAEGIGRICAHQWKISFVGGKLRP